MGPVGKRAAFRVICEEHRHRPIGARRVAESPHQTAIVPGDYRRFNRDGAMLNSIKYFSGRNPLDYGLGTEEMVHRGNRLSEMPLKKGVRNTNGGDGMPSSICYHMSLVNLPIKFRDAVMDE